MTALHQKVAVALVLAALLGTLWSLYRAYNGGVTQRLRRAGWLMVGITAVEGLTGALLGASGQRPSSGSHFILGPLTLLPLPVALLVSARLQHRAAALVLAGGWLVMTGLALRATGTGGLAA